MNFAEHDAGTDDATLLRASLDRDIWFTREGAARTFGWNDRRFRHAVAELRRTGYPVISVSEPHNVYRKARSRRECEDFIERELVSRSRSIEEQIREMRSASDRYFGTDQLRIAI